MTAAAIIQLPAPHEAQGIFVDWRETHPDAQVLVAPCGVKAGKSMGCALWLVAEALSTPGLYCVWIAPTLLKCRIGYRYIKAMLPDIDSIRCVDGAMEIHLGNGSFIKFLHGRDAEVTIEGEAVDRFVIDEAGKQSRQLWHSTLTTITQTEGYGIITGTPRGTGHWYHDVYRQALSGDTFFCHATLPTTASPYVNPEAVEKARRLLPDPLFRQYYLAEFTSESGVYGSLARVWDDSLAVERSSFWVHPDEEVRKVTLVVGIDLAKRHDFTVFAAVNAAGTTVGYLRMRHKTYQEQMRILARFLSFFPGEDNEIRYDATGVGEAVGEELSRVVDAIPGDWRVTPVLFTNASKVDLVGRLVFAIERGWWRCPRIPRVAHEFSALEVTTSRSGLHCYAAPDGDHDDVHWAFALAISGAQAASTQGSQLDMIEAALSGKLLTNEDEDDDAGLPPLDIPDDDVDDLGNETDDDLEAALGEAN